MDSDGRGGRAGPKGNAPWAPVGSPENPWSPFGADYKLAQMAEEKALFVALKLEIPAIKSALENDNFQAALEHLAKLREPVDAFFEAVQVNADNAVVRRNRLNLMCEIRTSCLSVADLSRIEGS